MPVDSRHPCCTVLDGALWVAPVPVPDAAGSRSRDVRAGVRGGGRVVAAGGVVGACLLVLTAVRGWGVDEVAAVAVVALVGAVVGAATTVGVVRVVESDQRDVVGDGVTLPAGAVPLPRSLARAAPDDATGEELVLWATRALRLRRAREALLSGAGPEARGEPGASVQARLGRAEEEHRAARRDWGPVGELLGLPDP